MITTMWKVAVVFMWLALHCLLGVKVARKGSRFESFMVWCLVGFSSFAAIFAYFIITCYIVTFWVWG